MRKIIIFGVLPLLLVGAGVYVWAASSGISMRSDGRTSEQVTRDTVIQAVRDLPEVKQWLALFTGPDGTSPKTGGVAIIEIESESPDAYVVHASEVIYDDAYVGNRSVTFGWYRVDKKTGVAKQVALEDVE